MDERLVTAEVAGEQLGVSSATLRRWVRDGALVADGTTLGGHYRFRLSHLREQLAAAGRVV